MGNHILDKIVLGSSGMSEMYIFCDLVVCVQIKRQACTDQKTAKDRHIHMLAKIHVGCFFFFKDHLYNNLIILLLWYYCDLLHPCRDLRFLRGLLRCVCVCVCESGDPHCFL